MLEALSASVSALFSHRTPYMTRASCCTRLVYYVASNKHEITEENENRRCLLYLLFCATADQLFSLVPHRALERGPTPLHRGQLVSPRRHRGRTLPPSSPFLSLCVVRHALGARAPFAASDTTPCTVGSFDRLSSWGVRSRRPCFGGGSGGCCSLCVVCTLVLVGGTSIPIGQGARAR